jgi:hypothetical protein
MREFRSWFFEIYTKNPATGERGWDIRVGYVKHAEDYAEAKRKVVRRFGRIFDVVITMHRTIPGPLPGAVNIH